MKKLFTISGFVRPIALARAIFSGSYPRRFLISLFPTPNALENNTSTYFRDSNKSINMPMFSSMTVGAKNFDIRTFQAKRHISATRYLMVSLQIFFIPAFFALSNFLFYLLKKCGFRPTAFSYSAFPIWMIFTRNSFTIPNMSALLRTICFRATTSFSSFKGFVADFAGILQHGFSSFFSDGSGTYTRTGMRIIADMTAKTRENLTAMITGKFDTSTFREFLDVGVHLYA